MNRPILGGYLFAFLGLLFVLSCERQSKPIKSRGDTGGVPMGRMVRNQKVIAKEIVSILYAFGEALARADNTDAEGFATEVDLLSSRLENISKELDTLGPFPPNLRKATRKEIDEKGKDIAHLRKEAVSRPLQPEALRITENAGERFFQAWGSVAAKAGLDEVVAH
jgi:hypothetical protein